MKNPKSVQTFVVPPASVTQSDSPEAFASESTQRSAPFVWPVSSQPAGVTTCTWYEPGARLQNWYQPLVAVTVVATTLVIPHFFSCRVTLEIPASPASWMPSASASFHTKSPRQAVWYSPRSQVRSFSPATSVVGTVRPVAAFTSLSTASFAPWSCRVTT